MKNKTPIPQFISLLLLLAISWTTLSGFLQFCYGDETIEIEWGDEWTQEEEGSGAEDAYRLSGSSEEEKHLKRIRSLLPKEVQLIYQPWQFSCLLSNLFLEYSYVAVLSSWKHRERELLSTSKPPLFILYCTYTSCLPVLS